MKNLDVIYLFDWGNTLIFDDPTQHGKMLHWPTILAMPGAKETLKHLCASHAIYVATNAQDSNESEILQAFQRVELDQYISGYFCKANLGIDKNDSTYYSRIADKLNVRCNQLVMVGDTLEKDILPALAAGCQAIYLNRENRKVSDAIPQIHSLDALINKTA